MKVFWVVKEDWLIIIVRFIQMEKNKRIEDLNLTLRKQFSSQLSQTNVSHSLRSQNSRIIKLIRQKIYPLHASDKSTLIFPKLKEKFYTGKENLGGGVKKYIEIDLNEERVDPLSKVRTDLEEDLIQKYKINDLKKTNEVQSSQFNFYSKIGKKKKTHFQKVETLQNQQNQCVQSNRYSSLHEPLVQSTFPSLAANTDESLTAKINEESSFHQEYLTKIKKELQKQKQSYKKKINFTELLQGTKEKEDYSIQYIVSLLERKKEKQQVGGSVSAYETYSPNSLPEYMKILTKKKERPLKLWQKFQRSENLKDQINEQDLRSRHLIEHSLQKNIAVVEDECQIQQQNILSAKFRMKSNHRKMVQMTKNKTKK